MSEISGRRGLAIELEGYLPEYWRPSGGRSNQRTAIRGILQRGMAAYEQQEGGQGAVYTKPGRPVRDDRIAMYPRAYRIRSNRLAGAYRGKWDLTLILQEVQGAMYTERPLYFGELFDSEEEASQFARCWVAARRQMRPGEAIAARRGGPVEATPMVLPVEVLWSRFSEV